MGRNTERWEHLLATEKQRTYDRDFLARWDANEFWDTLAIGEKRAHPNTFLVEEEDVLSYNLSVGENHPLFIDPDYARCHAPRGTEAQLDVTGTARGIGGAPERHFPRATCGIADVARLDDQGRRPSPAKASRPPLEAPGAVTTHSCLSSFNRNN